MTKTRRVSGCIAAGQAAQVADKKQQRRPRLDAGERFSAIADSLYKEMLTPRPTREKATKGPAHMEGSAE